MIRLTLLTLIISFFCLYSFKDWFKSLCFLIVFMALLERPDVPRSMMGIPGMNPWNILFLFVLMGWMTARKREGLKWDMPTVMNFLLLIYLFVVFWGVARLLVDPSGKIEFAVLMGNVKYSASTKTYIIDYIFNTIKYAIPGLLLFDGCRSKERLKLAIGAILLMYLIIALQVIKWMPFNALIDGEVLQKAAARVLDKGIGYFRTDIAMMLAGGAWAIFIAKDIFDPKYKKYFIIAMVIAIVGLALTGGRTGYATFMALGLFFSYLKWKKMLILMPLAVIIVVLSVPAVFERFVQGFNAEESTSPRYDSGEITSEKHDLYSITSGRSYAWPLVIDKIVERPVIGFGREGMQNSGLSTLMYVLYKNPFPHPHNAYLQLFLDNGLIGAIPILIFFFLLMLYGYRLLTSKNNTVYSVAGGVSLSIIISQLITSIGAQSFYPVASSVGLWCAIGLLLRMYVVRNKSSAK